MVGTEDHYRNKQVLQNLQKSELIDRDFRFSTLQHGQSMTNCISFAMNNDLELSHPQWKPKNYLYENFLFAVTRISEYQLPHNMADSFVH